MKPLLRVAFFDMDGVLTTGQPESDRVEIQNLYAHKLISKQTLEKSAALYAKLSKGSAKERDELVARLVRTIVRGLKNVAVGDLKRSERITGRSLHLRPGALRVCRSLRKTGYHLVVITGAPRTVAETFLKGSGLVFDQVFANKAVYKNGRVTGKVEILISPRRKADAVRKVLRALQTTRKNAIAVGHSFLDVPMMEACGRAIAFNPDQYCAAAAKKHGWPIVRGENLAGALRYF